MARWLPSPKGICSVSAAAARSRLMAAASSVPPVMPVTMSGAPIFRPSRVVDRSISAAASSGKD